ncbi:hypothetical protein EYF80_048597 [Liparis tanakae]|uniref:Uncharacterized protein n=1 Tax=Liparis tanakae TaxID=230148 RepID=A0A4Z2FJV5_9TELE|nr:hypothetical protein EYF80_048597 [Liparis tanakae]
MLDSNAPALKERSRLEKASSTTASGRDRQRQKLKLTVQSQEVVEHLEQREAVPRVHGLQLQSGVHVGSVQRQEGLGVGGHQIGPPRERLGQEVVWD